MKLLKPVGLIGLNYFKLFKSVLYRNNHVKKDALKIFPKFTRKHVCRSFLLFKKVASLRPAF